ncbi:MAG: hypothetical protein BMS9Abin07_1893 [Acidimicrobiia bacterium]|nr:MAG: hypothetical protein BMS9Abin07_1893 [Acidimicrobiia bacterium]
MLTGNAVRSLVRIGTQSMNHERRKGRIQMLWLAILVVVATGCGLFPNIGDPADPGTPCNCPNTEQIVSTLDWLGDGAAPISTTSHGAGVEETPAIDLAFGFSDVEEASTFVAKMFSKLEVSGLPVREFDANNASIALEDVRVSFSHSTSDSDAPFLSIAIRLFVHDDLASAALQPFVDALGTID